MKPLRIFLAISPPGSFISGALMPSKRTVSPLAVLNVSPSITSVTWSVGVQAVKSITRITVNEKIFRTGNYKDIALFVKYIEWESIKVLTRT